MDKRLFDEVVYLLDEMSQDTSVPKNVRKNAKERGGSFLTTSDSEREIIRKIFKNAGISQQKDPWYCYAPLYPSFLL